MKKLLLGLLIISSISSYASTDTTSVRLFCRDVIYSTGHSQEVQITANDISESGFNRGFISIVSSGGNVELQIPLTILEERKDRSMLFGEFGGEAIVVSISKKVLFDENNIFLTPTWRIRSALIDSSLESYYAPTPSDRLGEALNGYSKSYFCAHSSSQFLSRRSEF